MNADFQKLADAVRERREGLGLSRRDAVDIAYEVDIDHYDGSKRAKPGISERKWTGIERAEREKPWARTLHLVDAVLRWPEGTARAILHNEELPSGVPVRDQQEQDARPLDQEELHHVRAEVAHLSSQVAGLMEVADKLRAECQDVRRSVDDLYGNVDRRSL